MKMGSLRIVSHALWAGVVPKSFAVGFGQSLERALILIAGARNFPGSPWKRAVRHQEVHSLFIGRARFLWLRPKACACNSSLVRCILSTKLPGCPSNVV